MQYVQEFSVRFADVDAAGIVYYPKFFHYYHVAFEDFFGAAHGTPYPEWIRDHQIGFPTVHVEADFHSPLRYGDRAHITVSVPRLGKSSLDFRFETRLDGARLAATARITKACVSMDNLSSCDLPADLREAFGRYGESG